MAYLRSRNMTFNDLKLIEPILDSLKKEGYETPTPIQEQAIPIVLEGNDLLACAQTGTGKTAAFALPILQLLATAKPSHEPGKRKIKALIVTPTRELAIQIGENFTAYGRHLKLKHAVIFGGVNQNPQAATIKQGVDILVATPGRLLDLISQKLLSIRDIEYFVLDEADRMLDMGFVHDVKRIIKLIPEKRQSLFFSATMPKDISELANTILTTPKKVEVTPVSSTAETIEQAIYHVNQQCKADLLVHVLKDKSIKSALVFTRTKHGADKVVKMLQKNHITAEAIHGNKSQNHRQRALTNFKNGSTRVMVATDIAARGIDIDELAFVVNYEIPNIPETYVHRIGRTGRAGASGMAVSFCDIEEQDYLRDIQKLIKRSIPVITDHPYPLDVSQLAPAPKKESHFNKVKSQRSNFRRNDSKGKPSGGSKRSEGPSSGSKPKKKKFFKKP